ncbi:hypothetical protein GH5_02221 [Leishmania sp. Ghana 2012 LV757]|uniref:hypothetical protein n=1 Tax=Leishmania sp. Ghana 2012 LV757 TaxID=2803181 RepID=UPI001B7ADE88|nr:hypothetical protein GH5_02221 [Leishmania sp. Ghana 2012 LV757]
MMDAGSVLDNLLARHRGAVDASQPTSLAKVRRLDRSTSLAAPPPKIVAALQRGVNPLMLGLQAHKAESTAREKAKRRRELEADVSQWSRKSSRRSASASSSPRTASGQARNSLASVAAVLAADTRLPAVPTPREMQRAREAAVSATLTWRYEELRAKRQEEKDVEERQHCHSSTAPVQHRTAVGTDSERGKGPRTRGRMEEKRPPPPHPHLRATTPATVSRRWRDVWRRRCTTRKIQRLSCGVTRASALRRYWYTSISDIEAGTGTHDAASSVTHAVRSSDSGTGEDEEDATAPRTSKRALTPERLVSSTPPMSVLGSSDPTEERCTLRRLRAARRIAHSMHCSTPTTRKRGDAVGCTKGVAATLAANCTAPSRTSRRQRKEAIRCILSASATSMWTLAARVVAERLRAVAQICLECACPTVPASGLAASPRRSGVLPLSLARLFPLFGALVEVQELELTMAPAPLCHSRNVRRSNFASVGSDEEARGALQLRVVQQHKGVVMEEYSATLGILLLPSENGPDMQAWLQGVAGICAQGPGALACAKGDDTAAPLTRMRWSPSIVRVPKHFSGASGSFAELVQLLLLRAPTAPSTRDSGRKPTWITSVATRTSRAHASGLRVLATVFCGEVHAVAEDCDVAACHACGDAECPLVMAKDIMASAYPLHRLLHRCL